MSRFSRFIGLLATLCLPVLGEAGPTHQLISAFDVPAQNPGYGALVPGPNGYYWGTTQGGGAAGYGTVYKVKADGTDLQTVLYFTGNGVSNKGRSPYAGLVSDEAGFFWGTTKEGGAGNFGTVFKVNASTGVLTTVAEFTNTGGSFKGAYPFAGLVSDGAGFLWGTTQQGGALALGTVFKVNVSTGALTTVVEFTHDQASNRGSYPYAALIPDGAGWLWGTTYYGGTLGVGTIFKIGVSTGVLTTVVEFTTNGANNKGAYPWAALMNDGAGSFWGTTTAGGALGHGTVFKVNASTGVLTTLVEFTNNGATNRGRTPSAALLNDGMGFHWGTTTAGGGATGAGTVFKVNASTGVLTTVVEFSSNGASNKGASPYAALLNDGAGAFLGTTYAGATGGTGTVFKVGIASGVLTTLVEFSASTQFGNGRAPYAGLVSDGLGSLWGTNVNGGGSTGSGTVFKLTPATGALTALVKFTGNAGGYRGAYAYGTLASDGLGFYWGTTQGGGNTGNGTIFKVNASTGVMTHVVPFSGNGASNRGSAPAAGLRNDGAGFLWGTTVTGGTGGFGTVFKISAGGGNVTTLVDFTSNGAANKGANPNGQLVSDGAGYFWGTTQGGGATGNGTIFKVHAATGVLTTVVEFTNNGASNRGSAPWAGLVSDGAGFLWGTTQFGGTATFGTLFKVNVATGELVTLVDFTNAGATNKGSKPSAPLANDGAGFFWGTTTQGGASSQGTVFTVNIGTGELTTVVEFTGAGTQAFAGGGPGYGALLKFTDGNLYGTTVSGGPGGGGTLYRLQSGPTPVTQPASAITTTTATLNGTINPNGNATAASFEFGTHPLLTGAVVIGAGTTTAGTTPEAAAVAVNGLLPGTTYYYRVRGLNAENAVPQAGAIVSFATTANLPPVAGPATVAIPPEGVGSIALTTVASDPESAPATLNFSILGASGVTVTPVSAAEFTFVPNGGWTGSGSFTYRVTDPSGVSADGTITVVDPLAPALTVPPNLTVEATGADGAEVAFAPAASDNVAVASLMSAPASGSHFPLGTTLVTVTAQDQAGNTTTRTFHVTVRDSTPPTLTPPAQVIAEAASEVGAIVEYNEAIATDFVGVASVAFSHPSGSLFAIGTTVVTVTAMDEAGNAATAGFNVTVRDTTPPAISLPANMIAEAASEVGAIVEYNEAMATDLVSAASVTSSHASGSLFAIGTTVVTVTAMDEAGNAATASFNVTVRDTTTPTLAPPAHVIIEAASGAGAIANFAAATATDLVGVASLTYSHASGSLFAIGTTTVTATALDQAGNSATGTFTVTVRDTTAPMLTAPGNVIAEATSGAGASVNYPAATATDLVGVTALTYSHPSGGLFPIGTTMVTVTARDQAGNSTTRSFSVTVRDTTIPVLALPGNVIAEATGAEGAMVNFPDVIATDLVEVTSLDWSHASGSLFAIGTTMVSVTATDAAGNSATSTFTVTVQDTTAPVLTPPVDLSAEATSDWGAFVSFDAATASDLVGVAMIEYSHPSGSAFPLGATTVMVTARDQAGNATVGTFQVIVQDTTPPVLTLPGEIVAEADSGAGAIVDYGPVPATDLVGVTSLIYSHASASNFPMGTTVVTVTAQDQAGNSATGTFAVTVQDTTAPSVIAPGNLFANASGAGGAVVNYPPATVTDAVGVTGIFYSKPSGSLFACGTTVVTVSASDVTGHTSTASFTVAVNPPPGGGTFTVSPTANVVQGDTLHLCAVGWTDAQTPLTYQFFLGAASLGAAGSATALDVTAPAPGAYTMRVRVTDALGAFAEAIRSVTVQAGIDSWRESHFGTGGDAGAAADLADPNHNGMVNLLEYALNGDPTAATTASQPKLGRSAGNALQLSFTRVLDRSDVTMIVIGADSLNGPWTELATSVAGGSFVAVASGATAVETGTGATRTVTVTDRFAVTNPAHPRRFLRLKVRSGDALPALVLNGANPRTVEAAAAYSDPGATATDPEDGPLTPVMSGNTVIPNVVGTYFVTWQATDHSGNLRSAVRTVHVVDTTPPMLTPPANVVAQATGAAGAEVNYAAATASDVVGVTSLTYSHASGSTFPMGATVVTVTALDQAGNSTIRTFTVSVQDTTAPVLTPPANVVAQATSAAGAVVDYAATATDLVGVASLTFSHASGSSFPIGTNLVSVTAMDLAGNAATGTFTVTVQDTTPPVLTLPVNLIAEATSGGGAIVDYGPVSATDLVGVTSLTFSHANASIFPFGTTEVTVTALDQAGNSATGTFTVTVQDTTAPVVTVPGNVLVNASDAGGLMVDYPPATATDAVGVIGLSYSQASGSVFSSGTTVVVVTASDAAGHTGTASFTVTVNAPPVGGSLAVSPAGPVHQGDLLHLSATGWTDAQAPLSYQFFLGAASLGAAGSATTVNVAAPVPGTYTLRVRVADGLGAYAEATRSVTVQAGIGGWRQAHFGTTSDTGDAADLADPNRNGMVNLLEYALNGDPMGAPGGPSPKPVQGWSAGGALQLTFTRYLDRTDLTLIVIAADSLAGPWTELATSTAGGPFADVAPGATAVETGTGASRTVTVTDRFPVTDPLHPRRFIRLKVRR